MAVLEGLRSQTEGPAPPHPHHPEPAACCAAAGRRLGRGCGEAARTRIPTGTRSSSTTRHAHANQGAACWWHVCRGVFGACRRCAGDAHGAIPRGTPLQNAGGVCLFYLRVPVQLLWPACRDSSSEMCSTTMMSHCALSLCSGACTFTTSTCIYLLCIDCETALRLHTIRSHGVLFTGRDMEKVSHDVDQSYRCS